MKRFLTKRGYAVRFPDGQYRGVYRDRCTARLIDTLATFMEFRYFDPPTIEPCRIWFWQRFGPKQTPIGATR